MKTITYFYVYVYFWIIKRTRAYQTRVPYYKELELGKLECCVACNSSLPISSSIWLLVFRPLKQLIKSR